MSLKEEQFVKYSSACFATTKPTVLIKLVNGWKPAEWTWTTARLAMPWRENVRESTACICLRIALFKLYLTCCIINTFFILENVPCEHFVLIIHFSPFLSSLNCFLCTHHNFWDVLMNIFLVIHWGLQTKIDN